MTAPRRFWTAVTVADGQVLLDSRPVRTPARAPLVLPTPALAEAVADEWRAVDGAVDPRAMPLTGLANAAIDRIASDPARFVDDVAAYAGSDLLCYRADGPPDLLARQAAAWDPPLAWAEHRYGVRFARTAGIAPVLQPPETLARLRAEVATLDAFHLAAMQPLTALAGSLVLALALAETVLDEEAAWAAAELDALWQAERWGDDPLAAAARADKRRAFAAPARLLRLLAS